MTPACTRRCLQDVLCAAAGRHRFLLENVDKLGPVVYMTVRELGLGPKEARFELPTPRHARASLAPWASTSRACQSVSSNQSLLTPFHQVLCVSESLSALEGFAALMLQRVSALAVVSEKADGSRSLVSALSAADLRYAATADDLKALARCCSCRFLPSLH